jgi:hypothetical protein
VIAALTTATSSFLSSTMSSATEGIRVSMQFNVQRANCQEDSPDNFYEPYVLSCICATDGSSRKSSSM